MNNEGTLQKYLEKEKYWSSNCYCPGKVQSQDSSRPIIFITAVLWAGVSRFHCDNIFFSSSVMETRTSVSLKNSARVIPKVWHIVSSLSIHVLPVKRLFLLNIKQFRNSLIPYYVKNIVDSNAEKYRHKKR